MATIKGCGYFFPFPVPQDPVLCSMKLAALNSRQKGRDFYDVMYLLGQAGPDYTFLAARCGIPDRSALLEALGKLLETVDLQHKSKDFEHLLFERRNSSRILQFREFLAEWAKSEELSS